MVERQGRHSDRPSERSRAGAQAGPDGQAEGLTTSNDAVQLAFRGRFERAERLAATLPPERAIWLRAYLSCSRGDFARAERLALSLGRASDRSVRVAAAITLGSVLRQTGRHAKARTLDLRALRAARSASERAHATIGLAADAVGIGDARACEERLHEAAGLASRNDWRAWIRLRWVRAEFALLTGHPRRAASESRKALERACSARAKRHEAKSLLFLGVALDACGDPAATKTLMQAARIADRIGARPIAGVARELVARELGAREPVARELGARGRE